MNSLAISHSFLLQIPFKEYNILTYQDAIDYPINKLRNHITTVGIPSQWNDFGTGDSEFFNLAPRPNYSKSIKNIDPIEHKKQIEQSHFYIKWYNKYFFCTSHNIEQHQFNLKVWNNPIVIQCINCENWIVARNNKIENIRWNAIDKINIPKYNVTFDVNSLFTEKTFLDEYTKLMSYFNLEIKNLNLVKEFYSLYKDYVV
jgi:YHS domain-containing protein